MMRQRVVGSGVWATRDRAGGGRRVAVLAVAVLCAGLVVGGVSPVHAADPEGQVSNFTGTGTYFTGGGPGISSPVDIAVGPDGNLWFTNSFVDSIGRITPAGVVSTFTGGGMFDPAAIAAGPDGNLWFTNTGNSTIGRITPAGAVTTFTGTGISLPQGIAAGWDGNLWFTNSNNNSIGRITPAGAVTNYTGTGISYPSGITAGPDGNLWFTNYAVNWWENNSIGRITPEGVVSNFTDNSTDGSSLKIHGAIDIAAGPDGNLWFANRGNDSIGMITPGGVVSKFTGTGIDRPRGITAGPDGNLWFTNNNNNSIGRIGTIPPPSVLLECDEVAGSAKLSPGLVAAATDTVVGLGTPKAPAAGHSSTCVTDPSTRWATLNSSQTASIKAKVGVGFTDSTKTADSAGISCVSGNSTYSAAGKLNIKWSESDPGGKVWASSALVRFGVSPDLVNRPDTVTVTGIVTKGVGFGGDVSAELLVQPVVAKQPVTDPGSPLSALDRFSGVVAGTTTAGGRLAPGVSSAALNKQCQAGTATITAAVFSTDGMSMAAFDRDLWLVGALAYVQSACSDPAAPECDAAKTSFTAAYAAAYNSGNYRTDSSIRITMPKG
jgi:streptogramin lyase